MFSSNGSLEIQENNLILSIRCSILNIHHCCPILFQFNYSKKKFSNLSGGRGLMFQEVKCVP
ncbi:hypothetical protein AXX17_AT1G18280 [Arabidopsis thaliana]|uniref:Uncharacterized protein n=1 Tax=Arabidopsis thaliana TaxID=3702 RepID=A0A178W5P4_ARATH|nr:hypothetical protein AXX17_AT1G18280 [Arabidopsis thaliana]